MTQSRIQRLNYVYCHNVNVHGLFTTPGEMASLHGLNGHTPVVIETVMDEIEGILAEFNFSSPVPLGLSEKDISPHHKIKISPSQFARLSAGQDVVSQIGDERLNLIIGEIQQRLVEHGISERVAELSYSILARFGDRIFTFIYDGPKPAPVYTEI